jgi:hypothetical protein
MATFTQIKALRLEISDPADCIDIVSVANAAALPSQPANQTVYCLADTGAYVSTDTVYGADSADYEPVELLLSDARIGAWLDSYTHAESIVYALKAIIKLLGAKMFVKKNEVGSEAVEFTSLKEMYDFYRGLLAQQQEDVAVADGNSTGKWGATVAPEIAGGNV